MVGFVKERIFDLDFFFFVEIGGIVIFVFELVCNLLDFEREECKNGCEKEECNVS